MSPSDFEPMTERAPCADRLVEPTDYSHRFVSIDGYLEILGQRGFARPTSVDCFHDLAA